jgi:SAM-dependent methyltransferase
MSRGLAAGVGGAAGTAIVVVATAARYRRLARTLPGAGDAVLEIGCSTGEATRLLAAGQAGAVVAVDVAAEMVARTRAAVAAALGAGGDPGAGAGQRLTVAQLDGRDTAALRALIAAPDLIFVDVGGDARLDAVALQLRQCLLAFAPRTLVLRSAELAAVCAAVREVEAPAPRRAGPRRGRARSADPQAHALESLLDLSHSAAVQNRVFAARRLRRSAAPAARARLAELAADPDARVRRIATLGAADPVDPVDPAAAAAPAGPGAGPRDGADV